MYGRKLRSDPGAVWSKTMKIEPGAARARVAWRGLSRLRRGPVPRAVAASLTQWNVAASPGDGDAPTIVY